MISFFATKNLLGAMIRGRQIADYIGGKYNPKEGYENDLKIYLKPYSLDHIKDEDYVDIMDGYWMVDLLKQRPQIKTIIPSLLGCNYLKKHLANPITYLPQQHLNWERQTRDRQGVTICGYIGHPSPIAEKIYQEIAEALKPLGIEFKTCFDFKCRQDAVSFYQSIDLLIVGQWKGDSIYKTPTKLINAASFGIPSIADQLPGYQEFEGYYVPFVNLENMVKEVVKFQDQSYYNNFAEKITQEAEKYHISRIAEQYLALK